MSENSDFQDGQEDIFKLLVLGVKQLKNTKIFKADYPPI